MYSSTDLDTHVLLGKFPKDERRPTQEDIRVACLVINTSDYCCATITQLEERVLETIDKELRSLISFQTELDSFTTTSATGLQILVRLVENTTDPQFLAMTRKQWSSIASVGDQSEHITQFAQTLSPSIMLIRKMFSGGKFFKMFCDKFAEYLC
jgi:vacuolar protein sorting-associated protein 53